MQQKQKAILSVILFVVCISANFLFFSSAVHAEFNLPPDLLSFYSRNITRFAVSNDSLLLYDTNDQETFYYMYYNDLNRTLNMTISLQCVSTLCPDPHSILIDYLANDTTEPSVKKAAGVFIRTNQTALGTYVYNLSVIDSTAQYDESSLITIQVLSQSFFKQFLHNLWQTIVFWK